MITGSLAADIVHSMLSPQFPDGKTLGIVVCACSLEVNAAIP
jgi:hypothetical protein